MIIISVLIMMMLIIFNILVISKDIRHPSNLYLFVWIVMLVLYSIPLINYTEVSALAYIFVSLSSICFIYSVGLGSLIKMENVKQLRIALSKESVASSSSLLILGTLGLASALTYYQREFGLANLIYNPGLVRANDQGGTGLMGILIFIPTIVFVVLCIQIFRRGIRSITLIETIYIIVTLMYMLVLPERTTLLNTLVWTIAGICFSLGKPQYISFRVISKYGPASLAIFVASLGFFLYVSDRTGKSRWVNNVSYAINSRISLPTALYDPYAYLTGSLPALSHAVDNSEVGILSLEPNSTAIFQKRIYQILTASGQTEEKLTSNAEYANIPFSFNTYTWLYEPLKDYSLLGSLIYVSTIGISVGLVWRLRRVNITALTSFLYGWAATACVFSIMTNKFSSIYFNYAILIVFLIYTTSYITRIILSGTRAHTIRRTHKKPHWEKI